MTTDTTPDSNNTNDRNTTTGTTEELLDWTAARDKARRVSADVVVEDSDGTATSVADHYEQCRGVYEELATIGDEYETLAVPDNTTWYVSEQRDPGAEYPWEARPLSLRETLYALNDTDRVLYVVTSYKPRDAVRQTASHRYADNGIKWAESNPLPGYEDLAGFGVFVDLDLSDDLKAQRGALDADIVSNMEAVIEAYCDAVADLYGGHEHVYALDSVGGVYVFGAPAATIPITEYFDGRDRKLVMKALRERSNEYLQIKQDEIEAAIPAATNITDPDYCQNVNRQYKAPLALHKDHDAVVTPIDTQDATYDYTPLTAVDDTLVDRTEDWAAGLTSLDYADESVTDRLVQQLWPDYYSEHGDWRAALEAFVDDGLSGDDGDSTDGHTEDDDSGSGDRVADVRLTQDFEDVKRAVGNLDIERVAEKTIAYEWTDSKTGFTDRSGSGKRAFIPVWGTDANSGNANFIDKNEGTWIDSSESHQAGPVEMALIAEKEGNWYRDRYRHARGIDWWCGVGILRNKGFEIPVYCPDAETADGDKMPLWSLIKAARALGVIDEDDLVERESEDGGTYTGFCNAVTYNRSLAAVEDAGFNTNREPADAEEEPASYESVLGEYADDGWEPWTEPAQCLVACLRARDDGAVAEGAEPPRLALHPIIKIISDDDPGEVSAGVVRLAFDTFRELDAAEAAQEFGVPTNGGGRA